MSRREIIVAFDPSSTAVGFAAMRPDGTLVEAALITPDDPKAGSFSREMQMCDDVAMLLDVMRPGVILVEWTKGKVGKRHLGRGAGLAVYGTGVGSVGRQCWLWARGRDDVSVGAVLENEWTRKVSKETRATALEQEYPELKRITDPGLDVHDAVGLCRWWLTERRMRIV